MIKVIMPAIEPSPGVLRSIETKSAFKSTDVYPNGVALTPDLVSRLRGEVLTLHPFYVSLVMTPAEKSRLDGLSTLARGSAEDADLLGARDRSTGRLKLTGQNLHEG